MSPEVSVCIPAYRASEILPATLRSVIASDHPSFEVVVIDNASGDGTDRAARRFTSDPRVRFFACSEFLGLADNWRRAMDLCEGEFVKLVCADDLIHPTALSKQAAVLRQDPSVSLVASRRHLIDGEGYVLARSSGLHQLAGRHAAGDVARQIVNFGINPIGEPGSVMFRRSDYEAVGGWDPQRVFNMDIDLFLRILSRGDLFGLKESLAAFRVWTQSLSSHHDEEQFQENLRFIERVRDEYHVPAPDKRIAVLTGLSWKAWDVRRRVWAKVPRLWSRPLVA
jgi:glycosyltransferase involved in cell wall biosynthesis